MRKDGPGAYALLVASADTQAPTAHDSKSSAADLNVQVEYGDHSAALTKVVAALQEARKYTANDNQSKMLELYIESFKTGSVQAHVDGSTEWVKDIGPVVESYIGVCTIVIQNEYVLILAVH